jgi:hypothetical protein
MKSPTAGEGQHDPSPAVSGSFLHEVVSLMGVGEHLVERERVLKALGRRAEAKDGAALRGAPPDTVSGGLLTTSDIAQEIEKSERTETLRSSGPMPPTTHGRGGALREHNTSRSAVRPTAVPAHLDRTGAGLSPLLPGSSNNIKQRRGG